jgi:hypothetical protein
MSLIATALVLAGALLGIAGLYEMAGDAEPDGTHPDSRLGQQKGPKL